MLKVLKFSAAWCGPCKVLAPIFNEVKADTPDVVFVDVDVDQNSALAIEYNIRSVPTLVFEKDGQIVHRTNGTSNSSALKSLINSYK